MLEPRRVQGARAAQAARWGLTRAFVRSRALQRSSAVVVVTVAALTVVYIALQAFALTGSQKAQRDIGDFAAQLRVNATAVEPGDGAIAPRLAQAARNAGARGVSVSLVNYAIAPVVFDQHTATSYEERDWRAVPYPGDYHLTRGRWPTAPGEVAVSTAVDQANHGRGALTVLSGRVSLRVVGVVRPTFGTTSRDVLAAPGTWASLGGATLTRVFPTLASTPVLSWTSGPTDRVALAVLDAAQAGLSASQREAMAGDPPQLLVRAELARQAAHGLAQRLPLAFSLPALLLPALSVLAAVFTNRRRLAGNLATLRAVGLRGRDAVAGLMLALSGAVVVAAVVGLVLGAGAGAALRPALQLAATSPLSPYPALWPVVTRTAASITVALAGAALSFRRALGERDGVRLPDSAVVLPRPGRRRPSRRLVVGVRRGLAVVALLLAAGQTATLDSLTGAGVLAGCVLVACLCALPDALDACLHRLPTHEPATHLSRQRLLADRSRVGAATAVLAAALALPLTFATLLTTLVDTEDAKSFSLVAPHQITVTGLGSDVGSPAPRWVDAALRSRVHLAAPVSVHWLTTPARQVRGEGRGLSLLVAVDGPQDVTRLSGRALSPLQRHVLLTGGVLDWSDQAARPVRLLLQDPVTGKVLRRTRALPSAHLAVPQAWSGSGSFGVVLLSAAQRLDVPTPPAAWLVYTGVTRAQSDAAARVPYEAGFDPGFIGVYHDPADPPPPPQWYAALVALGLLTLVVLWTVLRAQARALRSYSARLLAIGLPRGWSRRVLLLQGGLVVGVSTAVALVTAIVPNTLFVIGLPGVTLHVPWLLLAASLGTYLVVAAGVTWGASRGLTPAERLGPA